MHNILSRNVYNDKQLSSKSFLNTKSRRINNRIQLNLNEPLNFQTPKNKKDIDSSNDKDQDSDKVINQIINLCSSSRKSSVSNESLGKISERGSSYKKYDLIERKTPSNLCNSKEITHHLLPLMHKDNSKYKRRLIKYIKRSESNKSNTDSCARLHFLKESFKAKGNFRNLLKKNISQNLYSQPKEKRENRRSTVKDYVLFSCDEKEKDVFFLFNEKEIGISNQWQRNLKFSEMDDDIESDEDQIEAANRHVRKEVKEAVLLVYENKERLIRNSFRFDHFLNEDNDVEEVISFMFTN